MKVLIKIFSFAIIFSTTCFAQESLFIGNTVVLPLADGKVEALFSYGKSDSQRSESPWANADLFNKCKLAIKLLSDRFNDIGFKEDIFSTEVIGNGVIERPYSVNGANFYENTSLWT